MAKTAPIKPKGITDIIRKGCKYERNGIAKRAYITNKQIPPASRLILNHSPVLLFFSYERKAKTWKFPSNSGMKSLPRSDSIKGILATILSAELCTLMILERSDLFMDG